METTHAMQFLVVLKQDCVDEKKMKNKSIREKLLAEHFPGVNIGRKIVFSDGSCLIEEKNQWIIARGDRVSENDSWFMRIIKMVVGNFLEDLFHKILTIIMVIVVGIGLYMAISSEIQKRMDQMQKMVLEYSHQQAEKFEGYMKHQGEKFSGAVDSAKDASAGAAELVKKKIKKSAEEWKARDEESIPVVEGVKVEDYQVKQEGSDTVVLGEENPEFSETIDSEKSKKGKWLKFGKDLLKKRKEAKEAE